MAEPFFRETRVVQLRTIFGNAPCLKLSVDGYIGGLSCFGLPYGNPPKVSPAAGFALQGRGIFCGRYAGLFAAPTPTLPHGGGGYSHPPKASYGVASPHRAP